MDKKYELLKVNYDYSKTWYFSILVIVMSFAIASRSTNNFYSIPYINEVGIFIAIILFLWGFVNFNGYRKLKNHLG